MNQKTFLNLYAASALLAGLGLWAVACSSRFVTPAEARAHQPESTRALDEPRKSSGARAVPPSGGDLRRPTAGKPSTRAGLTPEKDPGVASESRVGSNARQPVARSQGVRSASERETAVVYLSTPGVVLEKPAPGHLRALSATQARRCRVPVALWAQVVTRESSWRPHAVSSAGAVGLAQVKPYHAGPLLDVFDPETNLSLGACLLRRHYERLRGWGLTEPDAWRMALHAYHGGQYRRRTADSTRRYAEDVMAKWSAQ